MADREPSGPIERLAAVRPDTHLTPDHAGHDRWLVVRATTDPADLSPLESSQARALLAACPACASLAADLTVIGRVTATSVVPPRPRDFRLTTEQAASARGGVLDRLRRWLGSPGAFAVRPLAGATLVLGLMLVVVTPSLRPTVTTTGDGGTREAHAAGLQSPAVGTTSTHAAGGPEVDSQAGDAQLTAADASATPTQVAKSTPHADDPDGTDPEIAPVPGASEEPGDRSGVTMLRMASPSPSAQEGTATVEAVETAEPANDGAPNGPVPDGATAGGAASPPMDDTTYALTLLGIVLAGVGLMVLLLSWLARRWQDPLLR